MDRYFLDVRKLRKLLGSVQRFQLLPTSSLPPFVFSANLLGRTFLAFSATARCSQLTGRDSFL